MLARSAVCHRTSMACSHVHVHLRPTLNPARRDHLSSGLYLRSFHASVVRESGHNKWSKIRHKKGAADASRGNLFSRLGNDITLACKSSSASAPAAGSSAAAAPGGAQNTGPNTSAGSDVMSNIDSNNIKLSAAIDAARRHDMPKANIEAALRRGLGTAKDGVVLEQVTYEAMLGPVGLVVECLTDKRTRTIANIKSAVKK